MGTQPSLVGISGLSGAGKTTASTMLASLSAGTSVYVGQVVLDEIDARGLEQTRENERTVRLDIRKKDGDAGLLLRKSDEILASLRQGRSVFVDAVLSPSEWLALRKMHPSGTFLLTMDASFPVRAARLDARPNRPLSREDLARRDETERAALQIMDLEGEANLCIENVGTLDKLEQSLAAFLRDVERRRTY